MQYWFLIDKEKIFKLRQKYKKLDKREEEIVKVNYYYCHVLCRHFGEMVELILIATKSPQKTKGGG